MKSRITKLLLPLFISICSFPALAQTNHVVISQLFGSGGVSSTLPNYDFIELYNPTASRVNLAGWSVQFAFGSATTYTRISLSGSILAKGYYLIQLGRDNMATGKPMPTPDLTYNYNINSPDMKIGLYNFNSAVTGANPSASAVDFVGTGIANGYETSASPQGSYSVSLLRKSTSSSTTASMATGGAEATNGNGYDTNNNSVDLLLTSSVRARSSNISTLPVHLLGFTLTKVTAGNNLRWQVDGSAEVDHFNVEKSLNGKDFSVLAEIKGTAAYQFTDAANNATVYYRLTIVSTDGKQLQSSILMAEGARANGVAVYPTLATSAVTLQFGESKTGDQVLVYSADGNLQQRLQPAAKQSQATLQVSALKPGTYVVQYLSASGQTTTARFVKAG